MDGARADLHAGEEQNGIDVDQGQLDIHPGEEDKLLDKKTAHDIIDRLFYDLGQVGLRAIRVRLLRSICGVLILFFPTCFQNGVGGANWASILDELEEGINNAMNATQGGGGTSGDASTTTTPSPPTWTTTPTSTPSPTSTTNPTSADSTPTPAAAAMT